MDLRKLIPSFLCGALRLDGVRRICGTCAKDGARSCQDRSRMMQSRDDMATTWPSASLFLHGLHFVAMATDRQMNSTSDRSDHPASHFETLVGRLSRVAIVGYKQQRPAALTNRAPQNPIRRSALCSSRVPVGSSPRTSVGLLANALAIATLCCSPQPS
jgi:hypothetical protein